MVVVIVGSAEHPVGSRHFPVLILRNTHILFAQSDGLQRFQILAHVVVVTIQLNQKIYPVLEYLVLDAPHSLVQKHLQIGRVVAAVRAEVALDTAPHAFHTVGRLILTRPSTFLSLIDHSVFVVRL